jgi:L-ribulokinase
MDGSLTGAFIGLTLQRGLHHCYRALLEASAYGLRWIVELLRRHGLPVRRFVATGGLPYHNPLLVQIYADVLGEPIQLAASRQGPALGAAILGVLAAGEAVTGFADAVAAIQAMTVSPAGAGAGAARLVAPRPGLHAPYTALYQRYRRLADTLASFEAKPA